MDPTGWHCPEKSGWFEHIISSLLNVQTCGCASKKNTPTPYVFCWNITLYITLHNTQQYKHTLLTYRLKSLHCMGGFSLSLFWQFLFTLGPNHPLTSAESCQDQCVRFKTKNWAETLAGVKYNIPSCVFISILSPQTKNVSWLWAFYACWRSGSRVPGPWSPAVIDLEAKWLYEVFFLSHTNRFWTVRKYIDCVVYFTGFMYAGSCHHSSAGKYVITPITHPLK